MAAAAVVRPATIGGPHSRKGGAIVNTRKRGLLGGGARIALALAAGAVVGVGGMAVARHDEKERAKPISAWDIVEKLDGKETKVTVVEVTLKPGQAGEPHRHPGPVIGWKWARKRDPPEGKMGA